MHGPGHDTAFAPVSLNGNPYTNIYWLEAEERSLGIAGNEVIRLSALSNLKDNLKHKMQESHRLRGAKADTGYYNYWKSIGPIVNEKSSNAFRSSSNLTHAQKMNVMRYRTGTLFNQKHAVRFNLSTSLTCPLCPHVDSALHMLSGCQHNMIGNMITKRHNTASRHIVKALTNSIHGANTAYTDIGSAAKLADEGVDSSDIAN